MGGGSTATEVRAGEAMAQPAALEQAAPEREAGPEPEFAEEERPPQPDLSAARSLLTELVPAGMGEVLVTDVWARPAKPVASKPEPRKIAPWEKPEAGAPEAERPGRRSVDGSPQAEPEPPPELDRHRAWERRQELRELGLLRERPLMMYDARTEHYWHQVRQAREQAQQAIVDPYTELVMAFSDVDPERMADHSRDAREYGQAADALLQLGRCYMVIGRMKGARAAFAASAKAEPYSPAAWWHLGVAHLLSRASAKAAGALENAVDQSPGDLRAEMALGLAQYHLRDYAGAEEHFRRQAGNSGAGAAMRSLLACSLRMQQKWEDARVELNFLRQSTLGDWRAVAEQCLDCVARGEEKRHGPLRARRRAAQIWKSLATAAATGGWLAYAKVEDLFRQRAPWAVLPLFGLALLLMRGLRGMSGKELPGEFGNAEQGLPCWQATTWMRPRRSEF
jgi:tetratricopeptide (TPR) repeat protein